MKSKKQPALKVRGAAALLAVALFFIALTLNGVGKVKEHFADKSSIEHYAEQARLVTEEPLEPHQFALKGKKREKGCYFTTPSGKSVLFTRFYAPNVMGYGGPMELLLLVGKGGELLKFRILKHSETDSWIRKIEPWLEALPGHSIAPAGSLSEVDTVTGATYTTKAVLKIMSRTGGKFFGQAGSEASGAKKRGLPPVTFPFILLVLMLIGALVMRQRPGKWMRRAFMIPVVIIFGFWLNLQFSSYHLLTLAGWGIHLKGADPNLFYYIILPLVTILAGNIYCGYLCPFGQLQELIGDLNPLKRFSLPQKIDLWLRPLKYIFLALLFMTPIAAFLAPLLELDILLAAFSFASPIIIGAVVILLALSLAVNRFWCRYLCPTGAWLSIMQMLSFFLYKRLWKRVPLVKKLYKIPHIKHCDLGVQAVKDNSCLCCDRCRYVK